MVNFLRNVANLMSLISRNVVNFRRYMLNFTFYGELSRDMVNFNVIFVEFHVM